MKILNSMKERKKERQTEKKQEKKQEKKSHILNNMTKDSLSNVFVN